MMDDFADLYQELILDHNKRPRNKGILENANHHADGHNPLCGDKVSIYLNVDSDDRVQDVKFEGQGCAISTASASLMTEAVKGKKVEEARHLFEQIHSMLTEKEMPQDLEIGKLAALSGVREFPMRIKCATLAWHTMKAALDEEKAKEVTTE